MGSSSAPPSSGGLTGFTSAINTTAPNDVVNVAQLLANVVSSNGDIVLSPKGTGAILAQIPDGLTSGGNKRGQYSVDLQSDRSTNAQVASGNYAVIGGGNGNTVSANYGFTGTGFSHQVNSAYSAILAGNNHTINTGDYTTILNGLDNTNTSSYGLIGGGNSNNIAGTRNTVVNGSTNTIDNTSLDCLILSGTDNQILSGYNSSVLSGSGHTLTGYFSTAIGASANNFGVWGRQVFSSNGITSSSGNQRSEMLLYRSTSGDIPTNLTTNNSTPTTTNQYLSQDYQTTLIKFSACAFDGADTKQWEGNIAITVVSGIMVINSQIINIIAQTAGAIAWNFNPVVSGLNLAFQVTGETGKTIYWSGHLLTNELIYNAG
jgi:hypothetical protein